MHINRLPLNGIIIDNTKIKMSQLLAYNPALFLNDLSQIPVAFEYSSVLFRSL